MSVYPYNAKATARYKSPGISFTIGDLILIESAADDDGDWLNGVINSLSGAFPSHFVIKVAEDEEVPESIGSQKEKPQEESASQGEDLNPVESTTAPSKLPLAPDALDVEAPITVAPSKVLGSVPTAPESPKAAPIPTSIPAATLLPASPQQLSFKERIAALNASGAGAAAPPHNRPKPPVKKASLSIPATAPNSTSTPPSPSVRATETTTPIDKPATPAVTQPSAPISSDSLGGQMSASDAAQSIGKGGSLKDRIAALQGLQLDTPGIPGRPPKPFKKKSVDVATVIGDEVVTGAGVIGASSLDDNSAVVMDAVGRSPTDEDNLSTLDADSPEPMLPITSLSELEHTLPLRAELPETSPSPDVVLAASTGLLPALPRKAGGKPKRRAATPSTSAATSVDQPLTASTSEFETEVVESKEDTKEVKIDKGGVPAAADRAADELDMKGEASTEESISTPEIDKKVKGEHLEETHQDADIESAAVDTHSPLSSPSLSPPIISPIGAPIVLPVVASRPPVPTSFVNHAPPTATHSEVPSSTDQILGETASEEVLPPVAPRSKIPSIPQVFVAPTDLEPVIWPQAVIHGEGKSTSEEDRVEVEVEANASEVAEDSESDEALEHGSSSAPIEIQQHDVEAQEAYTTAALEEPALEEEDPEIIRRRALAKRMAALGGRNPMMGLLPTSPISSPPSSPVAALAHDHQISRGAPPAGAFRLPSLPPPASLPLASAAPIASKALGKEGTSASISAPSSIVADNVDEAEEAEGDIEVEGEKVEHQEEELEEEEQDCEDGDAHEDDTLDEEDIEEHVEEEKVEAVAAPALPGNRPTAPMSSKSLPPNAALPLPSFNSNSESTDELAPPPPPRSYPTIPPPPFRRSSGSAGSIPRSPLTGQSSTHQPRNLLGVKIPQSSLDGTPIRSVPLTFPSDFKDDRRQRPSGDDTKVESTPVSATPSFALLMSLSSSLGAQISSAAYAKLNERSSAKPTSSEFIAYCFSRASDPLPPINNTTYGIQIVQFSSTKVALPSADLDEPRAGDIAVFLDARFKHNLTTNKVGSAVPHVAIVAAWDSKKRKLRVIEVAEGRSGVGESAYRIEDLKSGTVQVQRVRMRVEDI